MGDQTVSGTLLGLARTPPRGHPPPKIPVQSALGLRAWNIGVLGALAALWLASTQHGVRSVVAPSRSARIEALEAAVAKAPTASVPLADLAQSYVESEAPGLAVAAVESAPHAARRGPEVQHVYARALLEIGRASLALEAERSVLRACERTGCATHVVAAAWRRHGFLENLVALGVEDPSSEPELCAVAYEASTRDAHLATR